MLWVQGLRAEPNPEIIIATRGKALKIKKILGLFGVLAVALAAQGASADYVAYSVGKKGGRSPLPERIEKVDTKHLVNIEWGEYSGRKARQPRSRR